MGSTTKASFTPFVDPRVYQTSPTDEDEEDDESSATGKWAGPRALQIGFLSCKTQGRDSPAQVTALIADAQSLDKDTLRCFTWWNSWKKITLSSEPDFFFSVSGRNPEVSQDARKSHPAAISKHTAYFSKTVSGYNAMLEAVWYWTLHTCVLSCVEFQAGTSVANLAN